MCSLEVFGLDFTLLRAGICRVEFFAIADHNPVLPDTAVRREHDRAVSLLAVYKDTFNQGLQGGS
jgi:hypothetical protein